jgi:uncharacterized protein (TIGR02145 family)
MGYFYLIKNKAAMKKTKSYFSSPFIICVVLAIIIGGCRKQDEVIKKERITGYVQKGPFINGTSVTMAELNASLEQTGSTFSTQIINNKGTFELNDLVLASSYVEFTANGFYYDEVKGGLSAAPLTLFALSDIRDVSSVNVNILTHLEKRRVEHLVKQNNMSFKNAKKMAQQEIFAIFGFDAEGARDSEVLDISVIREDNAILLAISIILQGTRSVGDLTELLAAISNEIRETGVLSNEIILKELRQTVLTLNYSKIRQDLVNRYLSIDLYASIPDFEKHINSFVTFTGTSPSVTTQEAKNILAQSATLSGRVNPNSYPTTVYFEYGTTTQYGNSVMAMEGTIIGSSQRTVNFDLSNLQHNTTYHFRIKAENEKGVTYSDDITFKTLDGVATITTNLTGYGLRYCEFRGNITFDGGASITERGVVWRTSPNPTTNNNHGIISDGEGIGQYNAFIKGLMPGTIYYVRAYAVNSTGVTYGNQESFTTYPAPIFGSLTDIDGNTYKTVKILNIEWMAENLKVTRYNNGDPIPTGLNDHEWANTTEGAYAIYPHTGGNNDNTSGINSDAEMVNAYGLLYNWHTVNEPRGICPVGWRFPTREEYHDLIEDLATIYTGGDNLKILPKLLSCRIPNSPFGGICNTNSHPRWEPYMDYFGTDCFGFNVLPSGSRERVGEYWNLSKDCYIWMSPGGAYMMLGFMHNGSGGGFPDNLGCSIRCVRDI